MRPFEHRIKEERARARDIVCVLITLFLLVKYATVQQILAYPPKECQKIHIVRNSLTHNLSRGLSVCSCASKVSVITAYFDIGENSKHSAESFLKWNELFFQLADNMVIFTDEKSAPDIARLRSATQGCTIMVLQNLYQLDIADQVDWEAQFRQDPEGQHSTALYIIWNQKSFWLDETSHSNPFSSTHFFWADSGQFRDRSFLDAHMSFRDRWVTHVDFIPSCTMAFLAVEKFLDSELVTRGGAHRSRPLNSMLVRLGGGNFGGDSCAINRWTPKFHEELLWYIDQGAFVGKDQPIYGSICIDNEDLCFVVDGDKVTEISDIWFAMQPVLHGVTKPVPQYIFR